MKAYNKEARKLGKDLTKIDKKTSAAMFAAAGHRSSGTLNTATRGGPPASSDDLCKGLRWTETGRITVRIWNKDTYESLGGE